MGKRTICVIGAGCSGLPCIKACVEQGFDVVCYEQRSEIGGLWNYKEDLPPGWSTVMRSTVINTSKEMMAFSDYPPPEHYPNFMHHTVLKEYIDSYAEHFDLIKHINFNTVVTKVKKTDDYMDTGRYQVYSIKYQGSKEEMSVFDGVMIASGHHSKPYTPQIAGIHKFKGTVKHSQGYKNADEYHSRRVLVIGIGNSGLDAAVDLTRNSMNKVYVSTRRGSWIWNRVSKRGFPYDIFYFSKWFHFLSFKVLPRNIKNNLLERIVNNRFDHELYRLKPKHRLLEAHPTVNDALPNAICSGQIVIRGDVKDFSTYTVKFEDDTEEEIDEVILSTGYSFTFPFLEPGLLRCENNEVDLYKYVFPPHLPHGTLSFIGYVQPMGAIQPISEIQARWVARVMSSSRRLSLPNESEMMSDIKRKRAEMAEEFIKSQRHTVQVRYADYMCEIASIIGCNPYSFQIAFRKPKLFYNIFFGPCTPYIFRLIGPNKWDRAEEVVNTTMDRVIAPLGGTKNEKKEIIKRKFYYCKTLAFRLLVAMVYLFAAAYGAHQTGWPMGLTLIFASTLFLTIYILDLAHDFTTFI